MIKKLFIIAGIILLTIVFCLKSFSFKMRAEHYLETLSLKNLSTQMMSEMIKNFDTSECDNQIRIKCKGFDIFVTRINDICLFNRIEISDKAYKFTWNRIGVGADKKEVEKAYIFNTPIKDLDSNQIGYIIDDLWVEFQLSDEDIVEKILLFYGP